MMNADAATRTPIVGVLGSGIDPHAERCEPLGEWLARRGVHLLTGGGGGVMECVSGAFHAVSPRRGLVIGIIPGSVRDGRYEYAPEYPNRWVEVPIFTHLPLRGPRGTDPMSRNHINVLSADLLIALPGGAGTASEVRLAVKYGKPVVAFCASRGDIEGLPPEVPLAPDLIDVKEFARGKI
jgi:uncharacterized protein (TIGR00725 family)